MVVGGVIMVFCELECLCVCFDGACVWAVVIIAPCGADEGRWCLVSGVVDDSDTTFCMLSPQLSDEREIASSIDVCLYLWDEVGECECCGVSGIVITV